MSTYALGSIFNPASVVVIGASTRERSAGRIALRSLREAGFKGRIGIVNRNYSEIDGIATVAGIEALDWVPELAVVTVPAGEVPKVVRKAAIKGVKAAIVMSNGLQRDGGLLLRDLYAVVREYGIRVVGPNCQGLIVPHAHFNTSFAARGPLAGDLAVISQSATIAGGMIEWAAARDIGFSALVALGDALDVDFGDLLDWFALDRHTRAILMYVESIRDARKFMSAARAAAKAKPVIVVKSGRHAPDERVHATHASALARSDAVYGAAFRRAGLLRVQGLDDLFSAVETMGHVRSVTGRRLAILGNGSGIGRMAVDRLIDYYGTLAELSPPTVEALDTIASARRARVNPVDIGGDADGERYAVALEALLADRENDAVMLINVPTERSSALEVAQAVSATLGKRPRNAARKPVFAVWLDNEAATHDILKKASVPTYQTEADAVRGFMYLVRYREAQQALMETPPNLPDDLVVDTVTAQRLVDEALTAGHAWLDPIATTRLLEAYGIPVTPVKLARTGDEAVQAAEPLLASGSPVAVKVLSPDIVHKSDVDGVRLNLLNADAVRDAAEDILARARQLRPDARIEGVTVHPMIVRPKARELIAGIADDPTFGPVIVFGRGGTAVEIIDDKSLALPPLDLRLAHEMIGRTRASRILKAYRDVPAADERAVALVLVKLAQLVADVPEIRELDINPLLVDRDGVIAVDARVVVAPARRLHKGPGNPRFAIRPYPKEWERMITLSSGKQAFVRPVRPEDDGIFRRFFEKVSDEDLRLRFFRAVRHFNHEFIARLTQLDYGRAIALVMIEPETGDMLGAVRLLADANYDTGEYSILVRSDLKGYGIGWRLMQIMIEYAHWLGLRVVEGQVLRENRTMLDMCRHLGFKLVPDPDDMSIVNVRLPVNAQTQRSSAATTSG